MHARRESADKREAGSAGAGEGHRAGDPERGGAASERTMLRLKRAYEPAQPDDGYRVLVERLWPRGVSKARASLDAWAKELAPSDTLRRWYNHDPAKWDEFRVRYRRELAAPERQTALVDLANRSRRQVVTLVYASKAGEISNAAALKEFLESGGPEPS